MSSHSHQHASATQNQYYLITNVHSPTTPKEKEIDLGAASWKLPYTIDDSDLTFDGKPLNMLYEENKWKVEHERVSSRDERRGRTQRRTWRVEEGRNQITVPGNITGIKVANKARLKSCLVPPKVTAVATGEEWRTQKIANARVVDWARRVLMMGYDYENDAGSKFWLWWWGKTEDVPAQMRLNVDMRRWRRRN